MDQNAFTGTQTIHPNNIKTAVPTPEYSTAQVKHIMFRRQRMIAARDVRDAPKPEWDDMGFLKYMDVLKKADDQYVAPRKNKQDTSINVGTVRDKDTTLVEYAQKYDWEPVAQVYDDSDEMLEEMAETGEDLVKKSLHLEGDKEKQKLVNRSMIAFGTALVQDHWVEQWIVQKTIKKGYQGQLGSSKQEWEDKMVKRYEGCQAKLWDLRKCYFGDIRKFFMNGPEGQPYFFTVEYESYDVVKQLFGNWDMWKFVPTTIVYTPEFTSVINYTAGWSLRPVSLNYCEISFYYDPILNEYAITINGVDMLPIMEKKIVENGEQKTLVSGYPLTEISPSGYIPYAKYDLEPMHDFAYSKGQAAKMRILADVENMLIKLNLGMVKQKAKPTVGNKSGRMFDDSVTDPATVINDVREGDIFPILPNFQGMSQSDFSFYELVKKELSKNSIEDSFQGIDNKPGEETATEDMNNRKAQSLKVAAMIDGIISGRCQLFWLRNYSLARNWTKPIDVRIDVFNKSVENHYRTVTMPSDLKSGQKATKKIVFTTKTPKTKDGKATIKDSQDIHQKELDHKKENGGEIRTTLLHPELFREYMESMKLTWFYTCVPVPNEADPLAYMIFAKQIVDAQTFFGPDSLNVKKLKHKFANMTGQDFDTWFISEQELEQKRQAAAQAAQDPAAAGGQSIPGKPVANQPAPAGPNAQANPMAKLGSIMK